MTVVSVQWSLEEKQITLCERYKYCRPFQLVVDQPWKKNGDCNLSNQKQTVHVQYLLSFLGFNSIQLQHYFKM